MQFTFYIGNRNCHISESHLRDIIDNKKEYVFSTWEKFIDFFRNIFTGRSSIAEYKEIYDLLCQKKTSSDIKGPFSPGPFSARDNDQTRWRPILGYAKLIASSRIETINKYTVDVFAQHEDMSLVKMYYDGMLVTETECSHRCLDFLTETMFNGNTGEITLLALNPEDLPFCESSGNGVYDAFEQRLIEYLSTPCQLSAKHEAVEQAGVLPPNTPQVISLQTQSSQVNAPQVADIEVFIRSDEFKKITTLADIERNKIGSGSYGTVYLLEGGFVVKIPISNRGKRVDFTSPEHSNSHPERVSKYLNIANDDANFSRAVTMNIEGKSIMVLVSKYIAGKEADIENDYEKIDELLRSRGVYMHDMNILGNILVKDNCFYFVDGDQIVLSEERRQQRRVSFATTQLEEQIRANYQVKLKRAETAGNSEDIEYYTALIEDLDALIGKGGANG